MASDRRSLKALRGSLSEPDLILETTPLLPENRTAACRENLRAALALADDLLNQAKMTPAAVMGHKGGASISVRTTTRAWRQHATRAGGRPRKQID